jgi:SAM-dependent MidA family methyltransferase
MSLPVDLPEPGADELAHGARVTERIRLEIEKHRGWLDFARYMELALYEPGLGYYSAGARKLGADGDFVTAPEIAPVFSRCLATQCAELLAPAGGDGLLELGAGSGALAAELLLELELLGALPRRYAILDRSAELRDRQLHTLRARAPALLPRVEWLDRLPEGWRGGILANEVLDALPVARFRMREGRARPLGVGWSQGTLVSEEGPEDPQLARAVARIEQDLGTPLAEGYESEINLGLEPWLAGIAGALGRGVLLCIDYGLPRREYYAPDRNRGTLRCHYRHRVHDDPLWRPGLQDIGAWVDFTAVADAALAAGLDLAGYTTQAHFLLGCGLADQLERAADRPDVERLRLSQQVQLLTLPGEMGERFKVIALASRYDAPLRGFGVRDLRHTL